MKILILGGTGAMGKPLVRKLAETHRDSTIFVTSRRSIKSEYENVVYIKGNARDFAFIKNLMGGTYYHAIVDFMNYNLDELDVRIPILLNSTDHYIWTSSARVYADSATPLTEQSLRLLETSNDKDFLSTNRYALRKARSEDLLKNSGKKNFTIIRPYITYNEERLQLGILEKEQWLHRLLHNRPLVLSEEMLDHVTTLSHGNEVASAIEDIIEIIKPNGEIIQITGRDSIKWKDLLDLYVDVIMRTTDCKPCIYASNQIGAIENLYEGGYNTIYDRNYDRIFDSSKIEQMLGKTVCRTKIRDGISHCLECFIEEKKSFLEIDPIYEAYQDIITDSYCKESDFQSMEDWNTYLHTRSKQAYEIFGIHPKITRII